MLYKSNERKVFRPIVFQTKQLDIIKILPLESVVLGMEIFMEIS